MGGLENKINKLFTRMRLLEKKFEQAGYPNEGSDYNNMSEDLSGDISVNVLGFQNIQIASSQEMYVNDEVSTLVLWNPPIIQNGKVFSGTSDENFNINVAGKNVFNEFVITAGWEPEVNGFRTISLEDPTGSIISTTFIPDNIPSDCEELHKHQVVFKQDAIQAGGWKVRLYQNSGETLGAVVNMKVFGPFIF